MIFEFPKLLCLLIYFLLPKLLFLFSRLISARFSLIFKIEELLLLFLIVIAYELNGIINFLVFPLDRNLSLAFLSILSFKLVFVNAKEKKN
jgi:hypothetical protein